MCKEQVATDSPRPRRSAPPQVTSPVVSLSRDANAVQDISGADLHSSSLDGGRGGEPLPHTSAIEELAAMFLDPGARGEAAAEPSRHNPARRPSDQLELDEAQDHFTLNVDSRHFGDVELLNEPVPEAPINWQRGELIGAGAFGRVYLGMNEDTGELMAVKQVAITPAAGPRDHAEGHVAALEAEVKVLGTLSHPNIVRYLGTARDQDSLNIFLEYVPGGSIAQLLSKFGPFNERVIRSYTRQLLQGLEFLHRHRIMHRDIKGANLLVDNTGTVKLADFGASKRVEDLATYQSGHKSMKGTPYWMAPEVIKQTGHGPQADIWSVGCTVIEMATGKPPWHEFSSSISALFHIASSTGTPPIPSLLSDDAHDFLKLAFIRNPKERPSAATLLQHAFITSPVPPVPSASRNGPPPSTSRAPMGPTSQTPKDSRHKQQAASNAGTSTTRDLDRIQPRFGDAARHKGVHGAGVGGAPYGSMDVNPMQEPVWEFDEPPSPLNARASLLPPQSSPSPLALTVADESFGGVSAGETVLAQGPSVAGAQGGASGSRRSNLPPLEKLHRKNPVDEAHILDFVRAKASCTQDLQDSFTRSSRNYQTGREPQAAVAAAADGGERYRSSRRNKAPEPNHYDSSTLASRERDPTANGGVAPRYRPQTLTPTESGKLQLINSMRGSQTRNSTSRSGAGPAIDRRDGITATVQRRPHSEERGLHVSPTKKRPSRHKPGSAGATAVSTDSYISRVEALPVDTYRAREERQRDHVREQHAAVVLEQQRRSKQAMWEAELQQELELQRAEKRRPTAPPY